MHTRVSRDVSMGRWGYYAAILAVACSSSKDADTDAASSDTPMGTTATAQPEAATSSSSEGEPGPGAEESSGGDVQLPAPGGMTEAPASDIEESPDTPLPEPTEVASAEPPAMTPFGDPPPGTSVPETEPDLPGAEGTQAPPEPTMSAESEPEAPMAGEAEPEEPELEVEPGPPSPGEYAERSGLPEANSEMAVAELDGLIYVVGGYPSSRETQDTVQVYDPAADSWSLAAPVPEPVHHPVVVGTHGLLFSLGGQPDTARSLTYDPAEDEWTDIAPMPTARGAGAAAVIADSIYVVGGRPPAGNAFEVYDVSTANWEELPPLPQDYDERNHLAVAAIDGKIYVAGGRYDGGGFSSPMTDALDVYDPESGQWSRVAPMLRPRGGVNGVVAHGCFHVFGGEGTNTGEPNDVFPDHDVYDPRTDEWTRLEPLPTPVHGVTGAAFVDGLIYMPGGGTSSGGSSGSTIFQVFRPAMRCDGS